MSGDTHPPAGTPDRGAIQTSIREAAQKAQELQRQAEAARAVLNEAAAKVHELERQAAAAQKTIMRYQEQESEVARAIQDAQASYDEIIQSAKARAEEMVETAKSSADGIVRSARNTATDLLHKARESAQEQLQAAERMATERRALLQTGPNEAGDADPEAEETKKAAEEYLTGVIDKLDTFIRDRDGVSRSLEAAATQYAESLETVSRLRTEVQREILPAVNQLLRRLKGGPADDGEAEREPEAEAEDDTERLMPLVSTPASPKPERPTAPDRAPREQRERPTTAPAPAGHQMGEVVVSPIHSFLQATKFITALSQIQGVTSVKLKSYAGSKLTLDVLTAGYPVAAIDCALIDGFAVEVAESTDTQLVLRLGSPAARPVSR
ncbi:MAG TPA: hypothetical protein VEW91_05065 [bacterium]|nr:hypothetical protein [bacterium]